MYFESVNWATFKTYPFFSPHFLVQFLFSLSVLYKVWVWVCARQCATFFFATLHQWASSPSPTLVLDKNLNILCIFQHLNPATRSPLYHTLPLCTAYFNILCTKSFFGWTPRDLNKRRLGKNSRLIFHSPETVKRYHQDITMNDLSSSISFG